jgi:hypothetical protein
MSAAQDGPAKAMMIATATADIPRKKVRKFNIAFSLPTAGGLFNSLMPKISAASYASRAAGTTEFGDLIESGQGVRNA